MTTTNNKTALTTRQALGFIGAGVATLVGFVPLAIRATGGAIETLDSKILDNSLRDDSVMDQLLGQSRVHDQLVNMAKGYAAGMLDNTTIKQTKAEDDLSDVDFTVTPNKTKEEKVDNSEEIYNTMAQLLRHSGKGFANDLRAILSERQVSVLNKYTQLDFPAVDIINKLELSQEQFEILATK